MTPEKNQNKAIILALTAVLFWSTVPSAFKLGLRYQDNFQMLTGAALVSTFILGLTIMLQGKIKLFKSLRRSDLLRGALLGFLNPVSYYLILFKAYDLLPGQVAQPLNMVWPIFLVLLSIPMLKQKIGFLSILSMLISFAGVILLSFQGGTLFINDSKITGVFLALFTAILWALYWILNVRNKLDEVIGLFIIFIFASIYLVIAGLIRKPSFPVGVEAWAASAYIGVFEMGLAFVFWLRALQLSSSTASISNLVFIAPFLNLIFVHHILGEKIFISTIFGIILVVTGIIIQNATKKSNRKI